MKIPTCPNKPTCPQVDRALKTLKEVISNIEYYNKRDNEEDFEDIISGLSNWISELDYVAYEIEDLRRSNGDLRDWGNELVDCIDEISAEKDERAEELEQKVADLEYEVKQLETEING